MIGPIAATTIQMPVIIGAVLMGADCRCDSGWLFGLSALLKVITMPGADLFATTIMTYSPFLYIVIAMIPPYSDGVAGRAAGGRSEKMSL